MPAAATPANDMSPVAHEIQRRMAEKKLNPKSLARRAGVGPTYIYDIMNGKSVSPTLDKLRRIAQALDCQLEDLTQPLPHAQSRDPQSGYGVDIAGVIPLRPSEYGLIKLWRILPREDKLAALNIMRKAAFVYIPILDEDAYIDDE